MGLVDDQGTWRTPEDFTEKSLAGLFDPLAAGAVFKIFATGNLEQQEQAIKILADLDGVYASEVLVTIAASTPSDQVRRLSAEKLSGREPRVFAGMLVGMLQEPVEYVVTPVKGPGSPGELVIHGERGDERRVYAAPASPFLLWPQPGDAVEYDQNGLPVVDRVYGYVAMPLPGMMGGTAASSAGNILGNTPLGAAGKQLGNQMAQNQQQFRSNLAGLGLGYDVMPLTEKVLVGQYMLKARKQAASSRERYLADFARLE